MMKDYMAELLEKKFIIEIKSKDSRTYAITEKGNKFLAEYNTISNFMQSFGLANNAQEGF